MASRPGMLGKGKEVPPAERVDLIRRMFLEGLPEWKIREKLTTGLVLADGRLVKISAQQFWRDVQAISQDFRRLHENPEWQEIVAGTILQRMIRISVKAESEGKYHAAIAAGRNAMLLLGMRTPRWKAQTEEDVLPPPVEGDDDDELRAMTDDQLMAELGSTRERARALGLKLVSGG